MKTVKTSRINAKLSKSEAPSQEEFFTWDRKKVERANVEDYINELNFYHITHPTATSLSEYIASKNIYESSFDRLRERHPDLDRAYDHAKRLIGKRLWARAHENKASWQATAYMLHQYHDDFKKADMWKKELEKEVASASAPKINYPYPEEQVKKIHPSRK